jgi:hypothetical protein
MASGAIAATSADAGEVLRRPRVRSLRTCVGLPLVTSEAARGSGNSVLGHGAPAVGAATGPSADRPLFPVERYCVKFVCPAQTTALSTMGAEDIPTKPLAMPSLTSHVHSGTCFCRTGPKALEGDQTQSALFSRVMELARVKPRLSTADTHQATFYRSIRGSFVWLDQRRRRGGHVRAVWSSLQQDCVWWRRCRGHANSATNELLKCCLAGLACRLPQRPECRLIHACKSTIIDIVTRTIEPRSGLGQRNSSYALCCGAQVLLWVNLCERVTVLQYSTCLPPETQTAAIKHSSRTCCVIQPCSISWAACCMLHSVTGTTPPSYMQTRHYWQTFSQPES